MGFKTTSGLRTVHVELAASTAGPLEGTIEVPTDAVYAHVRFVSRTARDQASDVELMIHDDEGNPVRGARLPHVFLQADDYVSLIEEELKRFPDSYAAYRTKWFLSTVMRKQDALLEMVRVDMEALGDADSAEALWVRSYGHMLLGEEPAARPLVMDALHRFPASMAADRCYSDYSYQCYSQSITDGPEEVRRVLAAVLAEYPETWLARDNVRLLSHENDFPLAVTRAICEPWLKDDPLQPEPALILARKLLKTGGHTDEAARLAIRAVNGYLGGDARLAGDTSGIMTEMMLPPAFRTAAEAAREQGNVAGAIGYALASQRCQTRTDSKPYELEAGLWEELGHIDRAAASWRFALDAGSLLAAEALERLTAEGAEGENATTDNADRRLAPTFEIADVDGELVRLEAMRGSVVVLNFWGLGCAPCRKEVPQLNGLVREFEDRPVEFVALAGDKTENIRDYLAEHEFLYRPVAQAGTVVQDYGVNGFPTHVVIDRKGRITATLVGAGDERDDVIRVLIERALEE